MLLKILYHWFTVFLAIGAFSGFLSGIYSDNAITAAMVAAGMTIIHLLIKPILEGFKIPVNLVSLTIISLILNIIGLWVLGNGLLDGFTVSSMAGVFMGSLMLSILTWFNNKMVS